MAACLPRPRRGLILGKFLPPTQGHRLLAEVGRRQVDRLSVLVCSLPDDPIPGPLRLDWMRRMLPDCDVVHVDRILPQEPEDHPDFWPLWLGEIRRQVPEPIDLVFTSESYGVELARRLGSAHRPVDRQRLAAPVSGTRMRADPYAHWRHLPEVVRPWYCRRVVLFGPESTGKTTLARDLARHYGTAWVPEWARDHLDPVGGRCAPADIPVIATGQAALEDALAEQADRILFCDTDPLLTTVWSDVLFGGCPADVRAVAAARVPDLTLLTGIDMPWIDDGQRFLDSQRQTFFDRCRSALDAHQRPHVLLTGSPAERLATACAAIDPLLEPLAGRPPPAAQARLVAERLGMV